MLWSKFLVLLAFLYEIGDVKAMSWVLVIEGP